MRHKAMFPKLKSPAILSPMAGVTDVAFRTLCKRYGAGMTCTEFVSSAALVRGSQKTFDMTATDPLEKPVAVQLFGNSEVEIVEAARLVSDRFDVVDLNCGCPAWKVIKSGSGSALLNNPAKIGSFVNRIASAIDRPVTIKIRSGIDDRSVNAVAVARAAEDAGAAAVAVHGRTQKQGYSGVSDWELIKQVKESVSIPVIGNGDVFSPEIFRERLEMSGVDAILIARGAIGNPFIFSQINDYLKSGSYETGANRAQHFFEYLNLAQKYNLSYSLIKAHGTSFTKGIRGGARVREQLSRAKSVEEIKEIFLPLSEQ